jgi:prepilin-type N-terminal cleavage/methylation domain-containing protein
MHTARRATRRFLASERGFTLIELLITVSIIAIMASMLLFALYSAQESAKASKTRALITKLDAIIKAKWEAYQTRRVPIVIPPLSPTFGPLDAAKARLDGLRDLMRMELPDRYTDIAEIDNSGAVPVIKRPYGLAMPIAGVPPSSVLQGYFRRVTAANLADPNKPSLKFQGAECLYLIVMAALQEEGDSREVFKADNVGDVDADDMPEFLDGWGHPIQFLRWAPGFGSEANIMARGSVDPASESPDLVTLTVSPSSAARFSILAGHYVGGVMADWDNSRDAPAPNSAARITGYTYNPSTNVATFSFASLPGGGLPFGGNYPTNAVVLAPDPFDPLGVYPILPNPTPTYAIYPLIYSAGGDGCYCVRSETHEGFPPLGISSDPDYPLKYRNAGMNPFYLPLCGQMMGMPQGVNDTPEREPTMDPYYVRGGTWRDNIHNHMQTLK